MFNDIVIRNFCSATFVGELASPSLSICIGNPVCGDRIQIHLEVNAQRITCARHRAWGCATSIATGSIFCEAVEGIETTAAIMITKAEIAQMLGELEPSQHHCLEMLHLLFDRLKESLHSKEGEKNEPTRLL